MPVPSLSIVAPFGRNEQFGGSQRLTSLAERLEQRGFAIDWQQLDPRSLRATDRARSALGATPDQVSRFSGVCSGRAPSGPTVLAHSYLSEAFAGGGAGRDGRHNRLVDFVDLEWRVTADVARMAPSAARRLYLRVQSALLRRHERRLATSGPSLFVTESELEWALRQGADPETALLVPNELPASARAEAQAIWDLRGHTEQEPLLAYVGKVSHRPNHLPLLSFLDREWPSVRRAVPEVRLAVAGRVDPATAGALGAHPAVEVLGFVPDVSELLGRARAAVLPFATAGGSSLRVLFYALAGVPVVGSPLAFRGFPPGLGDAASDSAGWERELTGILRAPGSESRERASERRDVAQEILSDARPWDRLAELAHELDRR